VVAVKQQLLCKFLMITVWSVMNAVFTDVHMQVECHVIQIYS